MLTGEYEELCPGGPGFRPNAETVILEGIVSHSFIMISCQLMTPDGSRLDESFSFIV